MSVRREPQAQTSRLPRTESELPRRVHSAGLVQVRAAAGTAHETVPPQKRKSTRDGHSGRSQFGNHFVQTVPAEPQDIEVFLCADMLDDAPCSIRHQCSGSSDREK
jgi:hypothetical protein